jgi:hypothetical protein
VRVPWICGQTIEEADERGLSIGIRLVEDRAEL